MKQIITKQLIETTINTVIGLSRNCFEMKLGANVKRYTKEERKLSQETIDKFQIGAFPNVSVLKARLPNFYVALKLNLISIDDFDGTVYSKFTDHPLIIPILDAYGSPIAIMGRTLMSEEERQEKGIAKYINTIYPKSRNLFGLYENKNDILANEKAILVEGNFDVITAWQNGLRNVVAVSSSELSKGQICLISRYTNNITLLFDADDAGRLGMDKALKKFGSIEGLTIGRACLPQGVKDLDEMFVRMKR
jgi:DNA primase